VAFLSLAANAAHARAPADSRVVALQGELASRPSATAVLQARCDARHPSGARRITATLLPPTDTAAATADIRARLGVGFTEPLRTRHVALACGGEIFSEAFNWYVPSRLTPDMNRTLETTHTPFGRAVASLHFTRETLSSRLLPPQAGVRDDAREPVLENRGLLRRARDGLPIALVIETYRSAALQ
jgi:hypothetical protein